MTLSPQSDRQDTSVTAQYDAWARVYDLVWARYMDQTLPVALRTAKVAPDDRVLDLACGTGELLHRLAQDVPVAELRGIDISSEMVARARRKLATASGARVQRADAHDLPFADNSFDVVVCASTFHYFTRPRAVLSEVRRVCRSGGRFVLLDWCRDYWACRVMDAVLQWLDPAYTTCYTLGQLTATLESTSFRVSDAFRYRFDIVWGMMVTTAVPVPD